MGAVHKLRLQEEGVGGQKNRLFVKFYTIENVNGGGVGGPKKTNLVNIVCERPLVGVVGLFLALLSSVSNLMRSLQKNQQFQMVGASHCWHITDIIVSHT